MMARFAGIRRFGCFVAALGTAVPIMLAGAAPRAGAVTASRTFLCTGGVQTFTVPVLPSGVTSLTVDAFGAQGGASTDGTAGGLGGEATATIPVTPNETLEVDVGCQPDAANPASGGFNGGGASGTGVGALGGAGGGGGGASDVRQGGSALTDRVVVAGGGGGGGGAIGSCSGGAGGGLDGGDGASCPTNLQGFGATQGTGGAANVNGAVGGAGAIGEGGVGGTPGSSDNMGGGGGGGGYYGGGGGSGTSSVSISGGGGGGSGHTPSGSGLGAGVNEGSGRVVLTWTVLPALTGTLVAEPNATPPNSAVMLTATFDVVRTPASGPVFLVAVGTFNPYVTMSVVDASANLVDCGTIAPDPRSILCRWDSPSPGAQATLRVRMTVSSAAPPGTSIAVGSTDSIEEVLANTSVTVLAAPAPIEITPRFTG